MITREAVLKALQEYDNEWPENDYPGTNKSWLDNERYSVALEHVGRLYPPKRIYSRVMGIETRNFNTADATSNLENLGFHIINKPGATRR